ncbi:hypothetical protein AB0P21_25145 [Kribbella sp. NPDC056861]|uniref:hypothetical protein n=1 Tax=Kribbella sp. NPDC056861 TaxID=3154857 RepID=UPI003429D803
MTSTGPRATIAFLNIAMHGRVNPTLPIVAELVRRGHAVSYHTSPAFRAEVEAAGATAHLYGGGEQSLPDPPTPVSLLEGLARTAVRVMPSLLEDLREVRPDLIVHDSACLWGPVAARELGVPAASSFTTFAFNDLAPSPTGLSKELVLAAAAHPANVKGYVQARWELHRGYDARHVPVVDLGNIRQPLNLVYTSPEFQPGAAEFDGSYRFVGPSIGARPADPAFPLNRLRDPVLYVSEADHVASHRAGADRRPVGGCRSRAAAGLSPTWDVATRRGGAVADRHAGRECRHRIVAVDRLATCRSGPVDSCLRQRRLGVDAGSGCPARVGRRTRVSVARAVAALPAPRRGRRRSRGSPRDGWRIGVVDRGGVRRCRGFRSRVRC